MDINHIKYILKIYKTGSINKASNNLYVSQPYLSACLRKFEDAIGFCIFERHNRGVSTTKEGQKLIQDLEMLHNTYLRIEQKHKLDQDALQSLSISARRSSYIAFAIAEMINEIQEKYDHLSVRFTECTNNEVIEDISNGNADIGIIRFFAENKDHFDMQLKARYIQSKQIMSTRRVVLMSKFHPLSNKDVILKSHLSGYTEIIHGDFEADNYSLTNDKIRTLNSSKKLIQVFERASLLDLVSTVNGSYCWTTATHPKILDYYSLVEKNVKTVQSTSIDYIIFKEKYQNSQLLDFTEEKVRKAIENMK